MAWYAKHRLNRVETKALSALEKSGMPFVCCADNSLPVIINGRRYYPDFVIYDCILVEVDGYLVHNNDKVKLKDRRLQEEVDANNRLRKEQIKQAGSSMLKELYLLRFWARDILHNPEKNFIGTIRDYARKVGITT